MLNQQKFQVTPSFVPTQQSLAGALNLLPVAVVPQLHQPPVSLRLQFARPPFHW
jgi:hypothetical protein